MPLGGQRGKNAPQAVAYAGMQPNRAITAVAVVACGASAGVHAGLAPSHLREEPALGVAFIVAAALALAAGTRLALHPHDRRAALLSAALLAAMIAAWALSRTVGLPLLQPEPEAVDGVGVVTQIVQALGLVAALWLTQPAGGRGPSTIEEVPR